MRENQEKKFWLGITIGAFGGLILGRRLYAPPRMPNSSNWQRLLAVERDKVAAASLIAHAQSRYRELHIQRPRFTQAILRTHLELNILPNLALYQALLAAGDEPDTALNTLVELQTRTFAKPIKMVTFLNQFPAPFQVFKQTTRGLMKTVFPASGWDIEYLAEDDQVFGFNIHHCIYLETLKAYGSPELTPLFCQSDDLVGAALPPEITWKRSGTLGMGAEYCDFRWRYSPAKVHNDV